MAEVLERFRDKVTGKIFEVGSEFESKDKDRMNDLTKRGFLKSTNAKKSPSVNLEGTVKEVTQSLTKELGDSFLESVLKEEKKNKNRKGVIDHIESLLNEEGD